MGSPAAVTYGPVLLGVIFNVFLYGIMVTQTFLYFTIYKQDQIWVKLIVFFLLLCDTLNCAFDVASLYIPLITHYGDTEILKTSNWHPAMTAIIAFCVQAFFAWRVLVLIGSRLLFGVIALCCVTQFFAGLAIAIAIVRVPLLSSESGKFGKISIIWLTACAVADVLIAISLVTWLQRQKTHDEHSQTDAIIDRVSKLTIQTGMITALCAIASLILFLASPTGAHLTVNYPLSKLYSNSLMSSLNSRAGWGYGAAFTRNRNANVGTTTADLWSSELAFRRPDTAITQRSSAVSGSDTHDGGYTSSREDAKSAVEVSPPAVV